MIVLTSSNPMEVCSHDGDMSADAWGLLSSFQSLTAGGPVQPTEATSCMR